MLRLVLHVLCSSRIVSSHGILGVPASLFDGWADVVVVLDAGGTVVTFEVKKHNLLWNI